MYEILATIAQTWGLLLFILAFILVLIYALAPHNREKFKSAAQIPLNEEDPTDGG